MFGIVSEEIDSLYPADRNGIVVTDERLCAGQEMGCADSGCGGRAESGKVWEVTDYAEVLRVQDARVLGVYASDFYQGTAAMTCKSHGKGNAYYVAARTEASAMRPLFEQMMANAGIPVRKLAEGVECHVRSGEEGVYEFYLNWNKEEMAVSGVKGRDMVTGADITDTLTLPGYGIAVVNLLSR